MAILNISGIINSSFGASGLLVNAAQGSGSAVFSIDLRPENPIIIVQDNLNYPLMGWDINDAVAVITLSGPEGVIYTNLDFDNPDIVPVVSRYLNKTITLQLDPQTNYTNILRGNYTLKVTWYNSVLDEYENFQYTYSYNLVPPTIANLTTSGPYSGVLTSTDTTEYENNGNTVYQTIREHRIQYPTMLMPPIDDIVSSNEQIQVTPIYTNEWSIVISSFVEYRNSDTLRILWSGSGSFTHCVFGGCIGAMWDAINTMLDLYKEALACNVGTQEDLQKRLVIVNTAWHLLNDAYWRGDTAEADEQAYTIQAEVESTYGGVCGSTSSTLVTPCPPWTGGGVGGSYTFENALVDSAGNVTWGGALVQDTNILLGTYLVKFSGSDAGSSVNFNVKADSGISATASDGTTEGRVVVQGNLVTLELADLVVPANTRGYEITSTGIIEKGDFKAGYVDRQLVAKDYVDLAISAISANTYESGLNESGGVVRLGGALTQPAIITSETDDGDYIRLSNSDSTNTRSSSIDITSGQLQSRSYSTNNHSTINGYSSIQQADAQVFIGAYTGANVHSWINITLSGMVIDDDINSKGLVYQTDYSAQWTDHSLVTKKWVEDTFTPLSGSGTFLALTDTPVAFTGFGEYFVRVNTAETALEFVAAAFVPVTGGTFTGTVTFSTAGSRQIVSQTTSVGGSPGVSQPGTNLISFQDGDGDEQGSVGIDGSGNVALTSDVTGGVIQANSDLSVSGDIIVTGTVDGVDIGAWKTSYDLSKVEWDEAYSWGDHAGLYQLLDADLTAIAALGFTSLSFLKKTAADTWALDTEIYATKEYVDDLALTYVYVPDSTTVTTSDGYTGTNADVISLDGNYMQIEEAAGTPGFEVRFEFVDVIDFNNIFMYLWYHGGAGHDILVQLYNHDTLSWDTFGTLTDQTGWTIIDIPVALSADYISGIDESVLRLYHNDAGNLAHYIQVDNAVLKLTPQLGSGGGGVTVHSGLTGLAEDDHPQYALADGSRCVFYANYGTKQSSVDAGALGEFSVDDDYLYTCVVAGSAGSAVWKRTAILQSP